MDALYKYFVAGLLKKNICESLKTIFLALLVVLSFSVLYAEPRAYFSPVPFTQESIREQIIKYINLSKKSIDIAIFDFTADPIAQALLGAKNRDIKIRIIMDERQTEKNYSQYCFLKDNGFNVKVLSGVKAYGLMHNKLAIYDERTVQTGSYNWSDNAEFNSWENVVFVEDASTVKKYQSHFEKMWNYSPPVYAAEPKEGYKYVGSKNSNKYHYFSCKWAKAIYQSNTIYFKSAKEAQQSDYEPCKVCRPPTKD